MPALKPQKEHKMNTTFALFVKLLYVMLKPVGPVCNQNCGYCYYFEKGNYILRQKLKL